MAVSVGLIQKMYINGNNPELGRAWPALSSLQTMKLGSERCR